MYRERLSFIAGQRLYLIKLLVTCYTFKGRTSAYLMAGTLLDHLLGLWPTSTFMELLHFLIIPLRTLVKQSSEATLGSRVHS